MGSRWRAKAGKGSVRRGGRMGRPMPGGLLLALAAYMFSFALSALFAPSAAMAVESCPNAAVRGAYGYSGALPDCRAYEMVTPANKDSAESEPPNHLAVAGEYQNSDWASINGDRMAFQNASQPFPGSDSTGLSYLATRTRAGWTVEDLIPPQSVLNSTLCISLVNIQWYSPDLSQAILGDGYGQSGEHLGENLLCGHDEPLLVPGEPEDFQNLFVRHNEIGSYGLVDVTPAPGPPANAYFLAASADLGHVVFEEEAQLTPEAPGGRAIPDPEVPLGRNIYEESGGTIRLVTILPDGTAVNGLLAGTHASELLNINSTSRQVEGSPGGDWGSMTNAISADGSRIFFQAEGNLYVRENGTTTVRVDTSQSGGPGGGGTFVDASRDGSKVFFLDKASAGLTDSTIPNSGENLYEYDLETGGLTDLTPVVGAEADGVSGLSEDGSYVYFVAGGVLAEGATAGEPNLYLLHSASTTFIATLKPAADACDWLPTTLTPPFGSTPTNRLSPSCLTARVSANGAFIGFDSVNRLTPYDNTDIVTGEPDREIYLYDAAGHALSCASCLPSGARPAGPVKMDEPPVAVHGAFEVAQRLSRNVSDSGQVFFDTPQPLLPGDSSGEQNVYEYEHGDLYSVSTGTSDAASYFDEATPSGSDVFIETDQPLLPSDADRAFDIYDARVNGGFLEPASPTACSEEDCKGVVSATPLFSPPSSATFVGAGNPVTKSVSAATPRTKPKSKPAKCKKAYVRSKGKCVKRSNAKAKKSAKGRK